MRVLVTGADGFVGRRLVQQLSGREHTVIGVSRRDCDPAAGAQELGFIREQADLTNYERVVEVLRRSAPDVILHVAARTTRRAGEDALTFFDDNVRATLNVLAGAHTVGVPHVVYSSTMSVYGEPKRLPVDEAHEAQPTTGYGMSKLMGEMYGRLYAAEHGLRVTALRYSGIFGPGQNSGAIPVFITRCLRHEPIVLHGRGRPSSDFVWVDDVVQANLLAMRATPDNLFEFYNIGSGVELSVADLAYTIADLCHSRSAIQLSDESSPRDFRFAYDIAKARAALGYCPTHPCQALQLYIQGKEG